MCWSCQGVGALFSSAKGWTENEKIYSFLIDIHRSKPRKTYGNLLRSFITPDSIDSYLMGINFVERRDHKTGKMRGSNNDINFLNSWKSTNYKGVYAFVIKATMFSSNDSFCVRHLLYLSAAIIKSLTRLINESLYSTLRLS